jgi:hypothetical protein
MPIWCSRMQVLIDMEIITMYIINSVISYYKLYSCVL